MNAAPPSEAADPTFRLIYRSRDQIPVPERKVALGELFSNARSANKKLDITGALLSYGDWFVQLLEGEESAVRALYEHIARDQRHDMVTLLEAGAAPGRVFSRWSMARVAEDLDEPDTFLIAHRDGIAPAASLKPTAEQSEVLEAMRAAARGSDDVLVPAPAVAQPAVRRPGALSM